MPSGRSVTGSPSAVWLGDLVGAIEMQEQSLKGCLEGGDKGAESEVFPNPTKSISSY
jgi:hypothetical protein